MPRLNDPEIEPVYQAAEAFRDAALRTDGSLFTPGRSLWSLPVLDDLHAKFVGRPDESPRSFEVKLREQLHDAGPDTLQLAAEAIYVHLLVASNLHGKTKRSLIHEVLGWSPRLVPIPEALDRALEAGIASVGTAFLTKRPFQLQFLIECLQAWKRLPDTERNGLLADPWRFRQFLFEPPIKYAHTQREALLHLVFPDTFEPITSQDAKQRIAERFREHVPDAAADVDRQLTAIRQALEPRFGAEFHFYAPQVKPTWQPDDSPWGQFVYWAERFASWEGFEANERDPKLMIGERFSRVRDAVLAEQEGWLDLLKQAFRPPNKHASWGEQSRFLNWCAAEPQAARAALRLLWDAGLPFEQRIQGFLGRLPDGTLTLQTLFSSLLLSADAAEYPVFRQTVLEKGFKLTNYPERSFPEEGDAAEWYQRALTFLDRIIEESRKRGLELRDRLDAQLVLWCITRCKTSEPPVAGWPVSEQRALQSFRGTAPEPDETDGETGSGQRAVPPALPHRLSGDAPGTGDGRMFADLMQYLEGEGLHFSEELVANYLLALQAKRLVILSGISGTGKTQLALAVARYFQPLTRVEKPVHVREGAFEVQVQPYMAKHHQWAFRADLRAALRIPALESGETRATIEVLYPDGQTEQRVYRDAQASFWQMSITHPLRAWFDTNLKVGDRFLAEVLPADDEGPSGLRLSLPELVAAEVPLENYAVVAVRPDWTDNRGLLGYFNPLTGHYTLTPFLRLVLDAHADWECARSEARAPHPFFAILDEMNLARVEHYFSDFLSALESGEPLDLHQDPLVEAGQDEDGLAIPRRLRVPPNVFFTGTVNIDETTYMFSPKVLDRAFTLELNQVDLAGYRDPVALAAAEPTSPLALERFPGRLLYERPPRAEDWDVFRALNGGALYDLLLDLHEVLAKEHRHFGYRVANEIARFVTLATEQARSNVDVPWEALDLAILEKVLPKFHGTQQELEPSLRALFEFATAGGPTGDETVLETVGWVQTGNRISRVATDTTTSVTPRLPRTATKVWRMLLRLKRQGFTAFIE